MKKGHYHVHYIDLMQRSGRPALIIFDLDKTLWPYRLDKELKSPFLLNSTRNSVSDSNGTEVMLFHETLPVLENLVAQEFKLGIASSIEDISGAYQMINLLNLSPFFTYREIYPGSKKQHFIRLHEKSGVNYTDMIFFDDDKRNIRCVCKLGVTAIHVPEGISERVVRVALQEFMMETVSKAASLNETNQRSTDCFKTNFELFDKN